MPHLVYRCYAKVNLTLEVLRRRDDGYHDIASLVHTIGIADDLRIEAAPELLTRVEGLDVDADQNLVSRAAVLLATNTRTGHGAELTLTKGIPTAAGLGGGSSDAAATLVGLNVLWDTRLAQADLGRLAADLGSDVPFFLRGGAAVMRGRGDELQVVPPLIGQWLVLVVPTHAVPNKTAQLYAALERADFTSGEATAEAAARLRRQAPLEAGHLTNAFFRAACDIFAGLAAVHRQAEALCQRRFCLSGAGPALFALAADRLDAQQQQARLVKDGLPAYAVRTVKHARASISA